MKRKVFLYGHLKALFGAEFELDVQTAGEAIRALRANFGPVFYEKLTEGDYHISRGVPGIGMPLCTPDLVNGFQLGAADLHIMPTVAGRGDGVTPTIIGGLILVSAVAMAFFCPPAGAATFAAAMSTTTAVGVSYGSLALFGASIMLYGLSALMAPGAKSTKRADEEKNDSFSFGAVNVNEQNNPVPIVYGEVYTGSVTVDAGIKVYRI